MQIIEETKLDFSDVLIRPKRSLATSRANVDITRTYNFCNSESKWTGTPIIAANMDVIGTFKMAKALASQGMATCLHKYYEVDELVNFFGSQPEEITTHSFYTMGITEDDFKKLENVTGILGKSKIKRICCDVANGYSDFFVKKVQKIREFMPNSTLIAGNVCTPEMVQELIISGGADIVKVGIGSGACCTTRLVAGVGYPQLSAVIECADAAHGIGGHIISDGGCTIAADVVKALAAGADFAMLGSMLAGTDECGGEWLQDENENSIMTLYGMSNGRAIDKYNGGLKNYRAEEGRLVTVPYKGPVYDILQQITGGIRSACTYVGAKSLKELSKCTTFVRCARTHNTMFEKG